MCPTFLHHQHVCCAIHWWSLTFLLFHWWFLPSNINALEPKDRSTFIPRFSPAICAHCSSSKMICLSSDKFQLDRSAGGTVLISRVWSVHREDGGEWRICIM